MNRLFGRISRNTQKPHLLNGEGHTEQGVSIYFQGNLFGHSTSYSAMKAILDLYHKGPDLDFVRELNGSFNFVILDKKKDYIFIVSDKYASRPLFASQEENAFSFSSTVSHLLTLRNEQPSVNWQGWGQYLTYRFTLGSNTFFKGIDYLDGGTIVKVCLSKFRIEKIKYWDYSDIKIDYDRSFDSKVDEGVEVFRSAFGSLGKDLENHKIVLALSGGYDSRSIAAGLCYFAKRNHFDTVTTLHTCGPEWDIVNELTQSLSIHNIPIDRPSTIYQDYFLKKALLTDGLVQEHLWVMSMLDVIAQYETYVDGIAGDIIMRSTRVRPIHIEKRNDPLYLAKLFKKQFGYDYGWLKDYIDPNVWEQTAYSESWAMDEISKIEPTENRMAVFLMKNRVRNGIALAPNNIIGSVAKNVILPFFNDKIVSFGLSISHEHKFKFIYRAILDRAFPEIKHIKSGSDESTDKLKLYDERIKQFDENPRELISDFLEISNSDKTYMEKLFHDLKPVDFLDKKKFLDKYNQSTDFHRLSTMIDLSLWHNSYLDGRVNT